MEVKQESIFDNKAGWEKQFCSIKHLIIALFLELRWFQLVWGSFAQIVYDKMQGNLSLLARFFR